jgi:hypothetical protein
VEFEGYCVKCRTKRTIKQSTVVKTSKGRPMAKGVCPECGTTVNRFLSEKESKKQVDRTPARDAARSTNAS